jgi:hypothetical protein
LEFLSGAHDPQTVEVDDNSRSMAIRWLEVLALEQQQTEVREREQLVSITLDVIDASIGGESGIRNLTKPIVAGSYRLRVANYAKFATDAVDHCPVLPAGPGVISLPKGVR